VEADDLAGDVDGDGLDQLVAAGLDVALDVPLPKSQVSARSTMSRCLTPSSIAWKPISTLSSSALQ
jgi:hypothetical protein